MIQLGSVILYAGVEGQRLYLYRGVTGLTFAPEYSSYGQAWTTFTNAVQELGNGVYFVELDGAEVDTDGVFAVYAEAAGGADEFYAEHQVMNLLQNAHIANEINKSIAVNPRPVPAAGKPAAALSMAQKIDLMYQEWCSEPHIISDTEKVIQDESGNPLRRRGLAADGNELTVGIWQDP